ncbi:SIMPL domain-containing protein [Labilibaculum sp. K2S]|uniref:SIMPL domain-containing protein n=1 Tax=Labilibaculum sp. K2S TaxID=3056386 RepID=UPI0025A44D3C|nr:SIMPL domain-containing protein [Labilibaculum sp. K2S]MDM8159647.1 SIMPL domain-containing protein [Labilibaculum sp. K2S]
MKRNVILLLAVFLSWSAMAQAQKNFIDQNYIEVKGLAELEVVPDEIYLNIHLDEEDTKNKESIEVLEKQMFVALKKAGINLEKQLSVSDFASNLQNHFFQRADMKKSKDFELLVHDSKTLGKVFVELDKIKISNISILRVDHSEIEKYRKQVKINAVIAGKEKAVALAEAIGQKVGKAIYINEISSPYGRQMVNTMMRVKSENFESAMGVPDLDFQKIKLEYSVMISFALE